MVSVTDLVSRMQGNYKKMLDYFKEDPGMAYDVFFKTLHAFVGAFEQARKEVDEAKRQEVPRLPPSLPLRLPLRLPPRLPLLLPLRPPLRPPLATTRAWKPRGSWWWWWCMHTCQQQERAIQNGGVELPLHCCYRN